MVDDGVPGSDRGATISEHTHGYRIHCWVASRFMGSFPRSHDDRRGLLDMGQRRMGPPRNSRYSSAEFPRLVPRITRIDVCLEFPATQSCERPRPQHTVDLDLLFQHSGGRGVLRRTRSRGVGRSLHGSGHDSLDVANLESTSVVVAQVGTAVALGFAAHTAYNLSILREPIFDGTPINERVSVLIPARNEEMNIERAVNSVRAQIGVSDLEILVLDDASSDSTAQIVADIAAKDSRVRLIHGDDSLPAGWQGKQFACHRLSLQATGTVFVFIDADVELEANAIAACVQLLRREQLALVAPYPHQVAHGALERLVQPLVVWSWVATLPVGIAEKSLRPSLSAANGQLLVFDGECYRSAGGHESVRDVVLEDIALMRALKTAGFHCATVNGSHIAQCRMYVSTKQVVDGYTKSLWSAFGSPAGSIAVNSLLATTYLAPVIAMVSGSKKSTRAIGALGYLAGVASRAMVAKKFGNPVVPDSLGHPASIAAFIGLNALSWSRHVRGVNTWKGRTLTAAASSGTNQRGKKP